MKIPTLDFARFGLGVLGACALLSAACEKRDVPVSRLATTKETYALTASWPAFAQGIDKGPDAKVDILFMVDNSFSMERLQAKLVASFADFMNVIEALPGGVPDLHIGVVSSDMGAGQLGPPYDPNCVPGGDHGRLQTTPRVAGCVPPADAFLALHADATTGAVVTNYGAQPLSAAFSCIAPLGPFGCGFEHQLSSVRHALDPLLAPAENAGFLRDDAYLAIVLLTNEDDCSAPLDSSVFDPTSRFVSDPLGPLVSYRCNLVGHICHDGNKVGPPSLTKAGVLTDCRSAEDGPLDKVADFVSFLKGLKSDPARVFLAAVTGPATPYEVTFDVPPANEDPAGAWPQIQHSCTAADGTFGDPAVRITEAVNAFGTRGLLASICGDSMAPALHAISTNLVQPMQPACIAVAADSPGCTVVDRWVDGAGAPQAARIKGCAEAPDARPCWHLDEDATCAAPMKHLVVDRGATLPAHLFTAVECSKLIP